MGMGKGYPNGPLIVIKVVVTCPVTLKVTIVVLVMKSGYPNSPITVALVVCVPPVATIETWHLRESTKADGNSELIKGDSKVAGRDEGRALAMWLTAGKAPKPWLGETTAVVSAQENRLDEIEAKANLVTVNRRR
jgi:hypothetical protein